MAEPEIVVSAIERKGWHTTRTESGWRITSPDGALTARLGFTPSWTCLTVPLGEQLAPPAGGWSDAQRVALYRALLTHNEQLFAAKFALARDGTPLLAVEMPTGGSLQRVDVALEALTRYLPLVDAAALTSGDPLPAPACDRAAKERFFEEPPGIPIEVLASYVRAAVPHGWVARSKPQGITWPLGYKGQRMFDVYLTVTRAWTTFHIPVLPDDPVGGGAASLAAQQAFLEYLLAINQTWFMAKIGLDEVGRVLIMLEVPTQEFDFEMFCFVTRLLGAYLDLYAREIQIMAHLPADRRLSEMLGV